MTYFTNIQGALRLRAEYLKGLHPEGMAYSDGDMMYEAALYIERLEIDLAAACEQRDIAKGDANERANDRDRLHAELAEARRQIFSLELSVKAMAEQRDVAVRAIAAAQDDARQVRIERDKLKDAYEAILTERGVGAVRGPVFEQVKAQILNAVYDVLKANGIDPTTPKTRLRYVVQTVNGYGPNRRPTTWYKIVDTATPIKYGLYGFERVAIAYTPEGARRIADLFNESVNWDTPGALVPGDTTRMDTLTQFTTDQLRTALATAWSTNAARQLREELERRQEPA